MTIEYFCEDIDFELENKKSIEKKLINLANKENKKLSNLNFIFCSDEKLLEINQQYLNHDYYTDVITFDQSEEKNTLEGDIFISIERVEENAISVKTTFKNELERVMIHGTLHLAGYHDKTDEEKKIMTKKEDTYLSL